MNHALQVASATVTGNQTAPPSGSGQRYFLPVLLVPLLGCSAPTGDMTVSPTAALDLRAIDQSCARLTACGVPTRLGLGAGLSYRSIGDCRLGLGALLAGPSARLLRIDRDDSSLTNTVGLTNRQESARRLVTCVAEATTCDAIRACRGLIRCAPGATPRCEGSVLLRCVPGSELGARIDCAEVGTTCVAGPPGGDSANCSSPSVAIVRDPLRCEGNTLVDPGRSRLDCGSNARCAATTISAMESTGSCVPEGQLCAIGLDGMRHCAGWSSWPYSAPEYTVPTVLLSVDRPTSGRCAAEDQQGATDCVDGMHLRYCLGNVEHTIACAEVGATSCVTLEPTVGSNGRAVCQ